MPRRPRARTLLGTALWSLLVWLLVGTGFANYDTAYSLLWGSQIAEGAAPVLDVPVSPTPHPLGTFAGIVLGPLGTGPAEWLTVVGAIVAIGALAQLTYLLGAHWFGRAAGLLAALVIVTRQPVLSYGIRAYVDIPYVVFVLAALLTEARRPRAGVPVLALLALAGLLRPEAWLLSGGYLVWLALDPACRTSRRAAPLLLTAAAAPVLWVLSDLLMTGDPLYSLVGTRAGAETLQRVTGLQNVPLTLPRRLGEILREPVLLGVVVGGPMSLWLLRRRAALPAAALVLMLAAFSVLAAAGLPILGRYLLGPAALLAIFCGAGAFGWRRLPKGHPWRGRWRLVGCAVLVALVVFIPAQADRLSSLKRSIATQRQIIGDLRALATPDRMPEGCGPVGVPNHRPVPLLALWLDRSPKAIVSAQLQAIDRGTYVDPASARVERNFTLDPKDPQRLTAQVPEGFSPTGGNGSWRLFGRCG